MKRKLVSNSDSIGSKLRCTVFVSCFLYKCLLELCVDGFSEKLTDASKEKMRKQEELKQKVSPIYLLHLFASSGSV